MSHHESQARGPDARMVDRMLFFSDAVFAIVLTIMVLELHGPVLEHNGGEDGNAAIWQSLSHNARLLFAYLVSFALVGLWWSVHMRVTRQLHQFDWPSAVWNFVFLLTVTVIPFAASILGEGINASAAWEIYWGVNAAAAFALTMLMIVVSRGGGRLIGGMGGRERMARILQSAGPGIGFAAGAWLAAAGYLDLSRFCWVIIIPISIVARLIMGRRPKVTASEGSS